MIDIKTIVNRAEPLTLNVLLTKGCSARCRFCVENTIDKSYARNADVSQTISNINLLIENNLVNDVLLLGGEPFEYPYILDVVQGINASSIITTNAFKLMEDKALLSRLLYLSGKVKSINISLCHYSPEKRATLMQVDLSHMYENSELRRIVGILRSYGIDVRANVVLVKDYIDSIDEIEKMIHFCKDMGFCSVKFGELTARTNDVHYFVSSSVIKYNAEHYVSIPVQEFYEKCHNIGGTFLWKEVDSLRVYFNAPPDKSISGGLDIDGKIYHRVLFCDQKLGNSWNRYDGIWNVQEYLNYVR